MEFKQSKFYRILENDIPEVSIHPNAIIGHFEYIEKIISEIPANLKDFSYSKGKWTIAQLLGHIVDAQTVFLYRILNIARGEETKLPGFDEALWVVTGKYQICTLDEIKSLYRASANHTVSTVLRIQKEDLERKGEANGIKISAEETLIYLMSHEIHHIKILKERYLVKI
jgi:uncharacterized damage-inducible protein DinB